MIETARVGRQTWSGIKRACVSTALVVFMLCAPAIAAPPEDIDPHVSRAMDAFGVPGLAIAIVENGKPVLTKGYGVREQGVSRRVDERTAFPIGSVSKAFTAAALGILVDQKKLKWDDRVVDKLPGFQMYDPYATAHMTVRDLLTHRSGLGLGAGDLLWYPSTSRSRSGFVSSLRYLKPATGFRETYAYDNILYVVAGALVESVSGQTWENFIRENIFVPVGMSDATDVYADNIPKNLSVHGRTDGPIRGMGAQRVLTSILPQPVAPAGGINASSVDMARWMSLWFGGAMSLDGKRVFSEITAKELWNPVTVIPIAEPPAGPLSVTTPMYAAYALGWGVTDYRGHKVLRHYGGVDGAVAVVCLLPEQKVGISITINSEDDGALRAILFRVLDHYLGFPNTDWVGPFQENAQKQFSEALEGMKKPGAVIVPNTNASLPLIGYAGVYRDDWYGTMTISQAGDGAMRINFDQSPGMEGVLEHVADDTFRTRWTNRAIEDAYVIFEVRKQRITGATMRAVSPLADFSFDYQDLHFKPESGVKTH